MKVLGYLKSITTFAFRENPLLYASLVISALSVCLELAAMASLLPLASIASGQSPPQDVLVVRAATALGMIPDGRTLLLIFLGLFGLRMLTQFAAESLTYYLSKKLLAQLATSAFSTLVASVPLKEMEKGSMGSYITLIGDESYRAANIVQYLNQLLSLGLLAALYYAALCAYSMTVGLAVLAFLAFSFVAMFESFRISHRLGACLIEQSQAANSIFLDALNGLRSVRAFSAERYVARAYRTQIWQYVRTLFSIDIVSLLTRFVPALLLLGMIAVVAFWPTLSDRLALSFPFIVTIIIFLMRFFPVVGQTLNLGQRFIADARAGHDITHLLSEYGQPPAVRQGSRSMLGRIEKVQAEDVGFRHEPGKDVLREFVLRLERGKSYALVGLSGSGKSTFLDLLMGFYPVGEGRILLNGTSLDQIPPAVLRERVLLVSQDTSIFNDTVANNLQFGSEASQEELERACRIACVHDFITSLPQGYDTRLSYRGSNLSGGQKQRIGIARAVVRRPDVLLLDESTSALDADTREQLVRNLQEEFADRILLFVTHDAFVISRVDEVFDMAVVNRAVPQQVGSPTESGIG
jgi:ABC-type bacteriocin/lantibiotic exporter with double-glycine peptidase domain